VGVLGMEGMEGMGGHVSFLSVLYLYVTLVYQSVKFTRPVGDGSHFFGRAQSTRFAFRMRTSGRNFELSSNQRYQPTEVA
jgi:hypothetical protein